MNTAHKKFILLTLILFSIMIFANNAQAISDCIIRNRDSNPSDMYLLGYVSTMGHFADNLSVRVDYPKALFCNHALTGDRTDGGETIYFSDPNQEVMPGVWGSGHVSITNNTVSFHGTSSLGFEAGQCEIKPASDSCNSGDLCVFKISNPEQGHIGDCNDNTEPNTHNYQHKLCCTPTEYCRDGIDNTGDGLIDCASPECHQNVHVGTMEPERCDPKTEYLVEGYGNWQNTSGCVIEYSLTEDKTIFNSSCIGPHDTIAFESGWGIGLPWPQGFPDQFDYPVVNASYYCSYGINDDGSQTGGEGFCCPTGTRAQYDVDLDMWECREFSECGMDPALDCEDDYRFDNWPDWLSATYVDDPGDWCVSMLPSFFNPVASPASLPSSMGCCFVPHYGEYGFYHKADNIKTFGTK